MNDLYRLKEMNLLDVIPKMGFLWIMHTQGNQPIRYKSKNGQPQVIYIETNIKKLKGILNIHDNDLSMHWIGNNFLLGFRPMKRTSREDLWRFHQKDNAL